MRTHRPSQRATFVSSVWCDLALRDPFYATLSVVMSKRKKQKLQLIVESLSEYSEDELDKALATLQRKAGEDSDDSQPEPEFEHSELVI